MSLYAPQYEAEAAEILRSAGRRDVFEPTGRSRVAAADRAVLSSANLTGIVRRRPADRTIVARAGTPVAELIACARNAGQRLPFDAVDPRDHGCDHDRDAERRLTVGAVAAMNACGASRPFSGSVRDAMLGARFVTGLGEVVATGAQVLKHSTGLDLTKVLAGSWGQLGFITEVAFRLVQKPREEATFVARCASPTEVAARVADALREGLPISGAAYLSSRLAQDRALSESGVLLLRLSGSLAAAERRLGDPQCAPQRLADDQAKALWRAVGCWRALAPWRASGAGGRAALWMATCPAAFGGDIALGIEERGGDVVLDWRGARIWARHDEPEAAEAVAAFLNSQTAARLVWSLAPHDMRAPQATHPPAAPLCDATRRLKAALDPLGRFAPSPCILRL